MASNERDAFEICEKYDVDYVLVIFGGMIGYSGDDINKFLWMVRISGGIYRYIKEEDYMNQGFYRIDNMVSNTMKNSLMYRLCYYKFENVKMGGPPGYDRVRKTQIGFMGY